MGIEKPDSIWPEWEIKEQIGEGSFGKVYKAERTEHGMTSFSAIKVLSIPQTRAEYSSLRSEGVDEIGARTYFEGVVSDCINEIKLMESMKGTSNVVSVEDYRVVERQGEVGWDIYIRMELVQSFVDYLADRHLEEPEVIRLGIDVCSALELCAKRNVIHRDIKPENIFISAFGDFKVGDFGIARELEKTTGALSSKGTYNYMAPEVAAARNYDATVDTYSLGLVLYRLLNNNRMPFTDPDGEMVTYQQRKDAIDRRLKGEPLPLPAKASMSMAQVIIRACAFNPQLRFKSASEMKAALIAVKEGRYVPQAVPVGSAADGFAQPTVDLDATTAVRRAPQAQDYMAAPVISPVTQTFGKEKKKGRSVLVISLVAALCAFVVIGAGVALYVFHPWDPGDKQVAQDGTSSSANKGKDVGRNDAGGGAAADVGEEFYLAIAGGKVVIYQGSPGGEARLYDVTDIEADDLKPQTREFLDKGVPVADIDAAGPLLETYRKEAAANAVRYEMEYYVVAGKWTWDQAQAYCESKGGSLACIHNQDEYNKVLAVAQGSGLKVFWLGGYREGKKFKWVDGEDFTFTAWAPGEPNNDLGIENRMSLFNVNGAWAWYDTPNDFGDVYSANIMGLVMQKEVVVKKYGGGRPRAARRTAGRRRARRRAAAAPPPPPPRAAAPHPNNSPKASSLVRKTLRTESSIRSTATSPLLTAATTPL